MDKLKKGGSPSITKGENAGKKLAIDHVLPVALVPELAARFYNLEAFPASINLQKSADVGEREVKLAKRWHGAGLLSGKGLKAIERSATALSRWNRFDHQDVVACSAPHR